MLLAGVALSAGTARADSASEDEARARIARGIELYDEGDYRLALVELERAYEIQPSYKILYNIGQVHFQLGEYARAHRVLRRYLEEGGDQVPPERRAEVEKDLATLATRVATVTIQVDVPDAEIAIGDQPPARAPVRTLVEAGALRIRVSKPGYEPQHRTVKLAGGDDVVVRVQLVKVAREVIVTREGVPAAAVGGWILTGVLAAGAVGTGIAANAAASKFDTMRTAPISGSPEQAAADLDKQGDLADGLALTTDVLIVAAVLAGGVSLWLTLRDKPKPGTPALVTFW